MRQHVLVGRFGQSDNTPIQVEPVENVVEINLVDSQRTFTCGIGQAIHDLASMGVVPSEIAFDLLIVAILVHAADTRISRTTESQDSWTREIRLVIPVCNVERWNRARQLLIRTLEFLTGDKWSINFRDRPNAFTRTMPEHTGELIEPPFGNISLFSGGLDSLIGAIDILDSGEIPLLVSHAGDGATSNAQASCFNALQAHYSPQTINRLRVWTNIPKTLFHNIPSEDTTRGRSFLFFAVGIFAGSGLNREFTLCVPENGLIALNVPLDVLRLGSLSTRTTHPFYMARWNEMLEILEIPGKVVNPYWNQTKGEMAQGCAEPTLLQQIIPMSLSCSSPSKARWQGRGIEHCGYCTPCLIRRSALRAYFGEEGDPTTYTISDLTANELNTKRSIGQQIRSFKIAAERIRTHPDHARYLIYKSGPLSDMESLKSDELASVYSRGMHEVAQLLSNVRARPL